VEQIKVKLSQKHVDRLNSLAFETKTARQSVVSNIISHFLENEDEYKITPNTIERKNNE